MTKKIEITYNGVKYSRNALSVSDTFIFGWKVAPKITALMTAIGFKVTDFAGENSETFSKVIEKIFNLEDGQWIIEKLILNREEPLAINGKFLSESEVEEHFAGDFIKLITVAFLLAVELLGEREALQKNLSDSVKNIISSLDGAVKEFVENQVIAFKQYENSKKTSKLKKTQSKS